MEDSHMTQYDEIMQTRQLQMLKTVVPYLGVQAQPRIAMVIQFLELQRSMEMARNGSPELAACEVPGGTDRRSALLNDLRRFCTPKEQETLDMLMNLFIIMESYE